MATKTKNQFITEYNETTEHTIATSRTNADLIFKAGAFYAAPSSDKETTHIILPSWTTRAKLEKIFRDERAQALIGFLETLYPKTQAESTTSVEEILEALRATTDPKVKKTLRAKLRGMGFFISKVGKESSNEDSK